MPLVNLVAEARAFRPIYKTISADKEATREGEAALTPSPCTEEAWGARRRSGRGRIRGLKGKRDAAWAEEDGRENRNGSKRKEWKKRAKKD